MTGRPFALLAFSYDPQHALPEVVEELKTINDAFVTGNSSPLQYWSVSQKQIEKTFQTYRDDIRIFHFAGHAGAARLQTNFLGKPRYTFAEGLAGNVGLFGKGLKLVFLNGCSTKDQVDFFLRNGVPAVIATRKPLSDFYACDFARLFYESFTGNSTLEEAFEAAKNSFDGAHGNFCDRLKKKVCTTFLAEPFRGANLDLDEDESPEVYDLYPQGAHPVRHEKFSDWFPPLPLEEKVGQTNDPSKLLAGKRSSGYLVCNRSPQKTAFHQALLEKINGQQPAPRFFFIFDTKPNCPQLLSERFKRYALRELYKSRQSPLDPDKSANPFQELSLPDPMLFEPAGPDGAFTDLFKIGLSQIYYDKYGGTPPADNCLALLPRLQVPLLVVQHRIPYSQWRSPENQPKLEALLRFYLGPYAADLQNQLTERLVVLFQMSLFKREPFLQDAQTGLFARLQKDFRQVELLTNLPAINGDDVQAWERDFLGVPNNFIKIRKFFTIIDEVTGQLEAEPRDELPFQDIIEKLQDQITLFNKKFIRAA